MTIRLLALDWNGCLLDDTRFNYRAVCAIVERYNGTPPTFSHYQDHFGADMQYLSYYIEHGVPESLSDEDIKQMRFEYFMTHRNELRLAAEATKVLAYCREREIFCAIVSAEMPGLLIPILHESGLASYFLSVTAGSYHKETTVRALIEGYKIPVSQTLFVDDMPEEIVGVKKLGVRTAGFLGGHASERRVLSAEPDHTVHNFGDILSRIATLEK